MPDFMWIGTLAVNLLSDILCVDDNVVERVNSLSYLGSLSSIILNEMAMLIRFVLRQLAGYIFSRF